LARIVGPPLPSRPDFHARAISAKHSYVVPAAKHGERDPAIPIRFARRLFALANEPKQFLSFPDGGHFDLDAFGASAVAMRFINQ
jgi:fermentation-respiration switch protein FrsA (DUF1100 family)